MSYFTGYYLISYQLLFKLLNRQKYSRLIILVKRNNIMENSRNLVHQLIGSYQIDKSKSKYEKSPILKDIKKKPNKKHGIENLAYKY